MTLNGEVRTLMAMHPMTPAGVVSGALAKVARLQQQAAARQQAGATSDPVRGPQLPPWELEQRGWPNPLARSALFTAVKDEQRTYRRVTQVAALNGIQVVYTGEELRQDDASVVMTLLHLIRGSDPASPVTTSKFALLKELGWSINSREYGHLRDCLTRIKATELRIQADGGAVGYAGSLLQKYDWADRGTGDTALRLWLDPRIAALFGRAAYTRLNWQQRRQIGLKSPLALWLHAFLSTHETPFPISVNKYHELSGSRSRNLADYRLRLRVALGRLVEIGFLIRFEIRAGSDLVLVERASLARTARPREAAQPRLSQPR